jgi:hypothetical protein
LAALGGGAGGALGNEYGDRNRYDDDDYDDDHRHYRRSGYRDHPGRGHAYGHRKHKHRHGDWDD